MRLTKSFESYKNKQHQVIEVTCEMFDSSDVDDLPYDDFEVRLYINSKFIADISYVLSDAGIFTDLVDSVNWNKIYRETKEINHIRHAI